MNEREVLWILVANERGARLLRGRASGSGRARQLRLERVAEMENPWVELDRQLFTPADAPRSSERLRRRAEILQRYASEMCRWLGESAREQSITRLEVFAPPSLSGALRREYPPELGRGVREHALDLGRLTHERLESHPAVFELFRSAAS